MIATRKTSYITYDNKSVPFIRISGKWLESHGFKIGTKFILNKDGNKLILTPNSTTSLNNSSKPHSK